MAESGCYAVAGAVAAFGASDVGEIFTGTNVIRDGIFRGNQKAYDGARNTLSVASAGIVGLAACNPGLKPPRETKQSEPIIQGDSIEFSSKKLQHEYKHASDYGVYGNYSNNKANEYKNAIIKQVNSVPNPIRGTFRGNIDVYHFYDPKTGVDTMIDLQGNYIAGWKLGAEQIAHLLDNGNVR